VSSESSGATAADHYTIRSYKPADLDGVLRLDREVWNRNRSPEWFRWKYGQTPYADQTPVFVAECAGEIVGARPFLAFRLRIGGESVVAYQPSDTMVHPDHRRKGVFRQLTEHALSTYRNREPALFFNFPNQYVRPGYLALGWRAVGPEVTYYRIERPAAVHNGRAGRLLAGLQPAVQGYYAARKRLSTDPAGLTVRQLAGVPHDQLVALHNHHQPETIHAERTERFLRWRLASPSWTRRTYLVEESAGQRGKKERTTVAALVARSRTTDEGLRLTQVVEVAPLAGGQRWREALQQGLHAVISTHPETELFAVSDGAIPHTVLSAVGFLADDSRALSTVTSYDSMLVVRPNGEPNDETAWRLAGQRLDEANNWCVTFAERDTT